MADFDQSFHQCIAYSDADTSSSLRQPCQICARVSVATPHFGALTCRACAEFFRRSTQAHRTYKCKANSENDTVNGNLENVRNCRHCRLKKCYEMGMLPMNTTNSQPQELVLSIPANTSSCSNSMSAVQNEYQQIVCSADRGLDRKLIQDFGRIYEMAFRISHSNSPLPNGYINWDIQTLPPESNLLAYHWNYSLENTSNWDRKRYLLLLASVGLRFPQEVFTVPGNDQMHRDILICASFARTLRGFVRMNAGDKVIMLKANSLLASHLFLPFYSLSSSCEAMTLPNGIVLYETMAAVADHYKSDSLKEKARDLFINPMKKFAKLMPSKEEFMLLLALVFSNSATSGLSKEGQELMNVESERYAKILMQLQRVQHGDQRGAVRYTELLSLIWDATARFHKHVDLLTYLDSVLEQGCLHTAGNEPANFVASLLFP